MTAGISPVVLRGQGDPFLNVGAGLDYWLNDGFGLRVEVRHHVRSSDNPGALSVFDVRLGLAWR